MDGGEEALVRDPEQRHARRLVDTARLCLDDAVLDLVSHAQAVAATDGVGLDHQGDGVVEALAVDGDGAALLEGDAHILGVDLHGRVPELHAHDGFDRLE